MKEVYICVKKNTLDMVVGASYLIENDLVRSSNELPNSYFIIYDIKNSYVHCINKRTLDDCFVSLKEYRKRKLERIGNG